MFEPKRQFNIKTKNKPNEKKYRTVIFQIIRVEARLTDSQLSTIIIIQNFHYFVF